MKKIKHHIENMEKEAYQMLRIGLFVTAALCLIYLYYLHNAESILFLMRLADVPRSLLLCVFLVFGASYVLDAHLKETK